MLDAVMGFAAGFLGAGTAVFALRAVRLPRWLGRRGYDGHEHRFDTMVADGKGWRCGICGSRKGRG